MGYIFISKNSTSIVTIGYLPRVKIDNILNEDLIKYCKNNKIAYLRVDPIDSKNKYSNFKEITNKFKHYGLNIKKSEPIQLPKTVIINLEKSENDLLKQMKHKHRYNIKLAEKKGVQVKIAESEKAFNEFLNLYQETVKRQKYTGRSSDYISKLYFLGLKNNSVKIATAYYKSKPLASWFLLLDGDYVNYLYGGSSEEHRNLMPAYKLLWECILWAKNKGFKYFDLYGLKNDEHSGFTRFKLGFVEKDNSQIIEYVDTFDIVFNRKIYTLLRIMENIRKFVLFKIK
ncbi:MAG: hypothetical protein KatS3mg085_179 [Candidatus Dojkabacteria bacterium]|nr:MAG: hypothetical protein KatS3mg085_179 [Candidatus Dojkabacteria bacterium]